MSTPPSGEAPAPLLEARRLTCGYGEVTAVRDVELAVGDGAMLGVVGPSGSGKTTLLRALLGLLTPQAGEVRRRRGVRVAYVPQLQTVDWSFPVTVRELVLMARTGRRRLPWPSREERDSVATVLDRLGIGALADRHIRALSGGQQQRAFLARALLAEPHALFLDEPTAGLDVTTRHETLHLLRELHAEGLAVVLSTHDLNGIAAHLPWLVCLNRVVVGAGPPSEVLTADVLERTYGARMDVLEHGGMPVVVDRPGAHRHATGTAAPASRTGS